MTRLHGTTAVGATNRKKPLQECLTPPKAQGLLLDIYTRVSEPKDATAASSDPQGPGHASSNSEDEVFASSDPKAWAPTPRMRFPPRPTPRRGLRLLRPQGAGSDSSGPTGRAPPRPTPEGQIPSRPAPRARFPPRPFPRGWICYRAKAVAPGWDPNRLNTTPWRRTSQTRPDATNGRIRPC